MTLFLTFLSCGGRICGAKCVNLCVFPEWYYVLYLNKLNYLMKRTVLPLLLALLGAVLPQQMQAVDRTTLYAAVAGKGIYAFDPQDLSATPTLAMSDDNYGYLNQNAISAFGDGTLYVFQYTENNYQLSRVRLVKYHLSAEGTWSLDPATDVITLATDYAAFPHMFTYDTYSKKLYGFRRDSRTLYEINPATGVMTALAADCSYAYNSMVCSSTGNLYVMGETQTHDVEYLYSKDKTSIKHSMLAGYPNLLSDDVLLASFASHKDDQNLYVLNRNVKHFSETEEGVNNSTTSFNANELYTINMKALTYNQPAKRLGTILGGQKVVGFFSVTEEVKAEELTPASVTDLTITYPTPGQTRATLSAKAPTMLFDGTSELTGTVDVRFYLGQTLIGEQKGVAAGAVTSVSYDFGKEGAYTVRAVAANANGESPDALCQTYAGYDTPSAVTDLTLTINDEGHYTLTWQAPTVGMQGGVVNTSALTYLVTRYPGATTQTVSTTRTEGEIGSKLFSDYYFAVTPIYSGRQGETATSNHAQYGEAIELPYVDDFSDEATWGRHTIWNVNDDATWARGYSMLDGISAGYNGTNCPNQADDWLFTPPMKMHAGTTYTVRFQAFNNQFLTSLPTPLKLYVSPTNHPEQYTDEPQSHMLQVASLNTLPDWNKPLTAEYTFTNEEEGIKYLAFHLTAYPNTRVWIQNYSIIPGASLAAPADVTSLRVTPDPEGAVRATISFKAPTTTMGDEALTDISYISIYRDGDLNEIHRFVNPTPGAELSYTDEAEDLTNTEHEYKVKCFNDNGNSEGLARTILVGQDYASAPTNLRVEDKGDHYLMTWERPTTSVNGGYVRYDEVKFWIMIGNAEGEGNPITLEDAYDGTSYVVGKGDLYRYGFREDQMAINFWSVSVTPRGSHINGSVAYTSAIYGTPWDLPFNEGLAAGDFGVMTRTYPWTVVTYPPYSQAGKDPWYLVSAAQNLPIAVSDHDGTGGMFMWYQTAGTVMESYFLTPQITFKDAKQPTLTFWMWHNNGVGSPADNYVEISSCRYTDEYDLITKEPILVADGQPNGWRQHTIDLSEVPYDLYRLAFKGRGQAGVCFYLDDIVVDDAATGIRLYENENEDENCYDLQGRSYLRQPHRGIFIQQGRKIIR